VNTLKVELGHRSYPILIGEGLLRQPELVRRHVVARDILIVSNTTVAPLYMESLAAALGGGRIVEAILPDGEAHKTLTTVARVLDVLVGNRFGRDCTVVALGVVWVGDMAGFCGVVLPSWCGVRASADHIARAGRLFSRRKKPESTTLAAKNLIGAFHQPSAVLGRHFDARDAPGS